jgi:hypothetical protein
MSKTTVLLAAGAGYVLGARAGQDRYEQIKQKTTQLWNHPRVQEGTAQAQDLLKDNAPKVGGKIADVASTAASKARSGTHKDVLADSAGDDAGSSSTPSNTRG